MLDDKEIFEVIGQGPLGCVHRGHDLTIDAEVAIKVHHDRVRGLLARYPEYWEAQERLARRSAGRRDLVRILEVDPEGGRIVTDFLPRHLGDCPRYKPRHVIGITQKVLKALDALHTQCGVMHLAIHPGNIRRDDSGILLGDARGIPPGGRRDELISALTSLASSPEASAQGEPRTLYLAPELLEEQGSQIGPAADLYATGMTAVRLLVGPSLVRRLPAFPDRADAADAWARWQLDRSRSIAAVLDAHAEIPEGFRELLLRLTAKSLDERHDRAQEALEDLRASLRRVVAVSAPRPTGGRAVSAPGPTRELAPSPTAEGRLGPAAFTTGLKTARVGILKPARPSPEPANPLAEAARASFQAARSHWQGSFPIRLAALGLLVALMAWAVLPRPDSALRPAEFLITNDEVVGRLTVARVLEPAGEGAGTTDQPPPSEIVINSASIEKLRSIRKDLPDGPYLVTIAAPDHEELHERIRLDARRQFAFALKRRWVKVRLQGLNQELQEVRYQLPTETQSSEGVLSELMLPVGKESRVDLERAGYERRTVTVRVPRDASSVFDDPQEIRLERLPLRTRRVEVTTVPADAKVRIDGEVARPAGSFHLAGGKHTLVVQREGYADVTRVLDVVPEETPERVEVRLTRPVRPVRFLVGPETQLRVTQLTPDRAPLPIDTRAGETLELETGTVLAIDASAEGMAWGRQRTVVRVEPGASVQEIRVTTAAPREVRFDGLDLSFVRLEGGPFLEGFEEDVYSRVARRKLLPLLNAAKLPDDRDIDPAGLSLKIYRNRQQLREESARNPARMVQVAPFYASTTPVTWREWFRVMGAGLLPGEAGADPAAFLERMGDLPATNLPFLACQQFRVREEARLRAAGLLDEAHALSLPTKLEMEYLLKGGLSAADVLARQIDPLDRAALLDQSLAERAQVWTDLEQQATSTARVQPASAGEPNRLGIHLGNVASWIHDGAGKQGAMILGPSHLDRVNRPTAVGWKSPTLAHDFPRHQAYLLHDLGGFWPLRPRFQPTEEPPGAAVGFYLVIRRRHPAGIPNPSADRPMASAWSGRAPADPSPAAFGSVAR